MKTPTQQKGTALILSMLLLLIMTLLATMASDSSVIQERMSGNFRDMNIAFEAAENATRWSEAWLTSFTNLNAANIPCTQACTTSRPIWDFGIYPDDIAYRDDAWWNTFGRPYGSNPTNGSNMGITIPSVSQQPRYVMEQVFLKQENLTELPPTAVIYYRVTARGVGARPTSVSVVESTVARRVTP